MCRINVAKRKELHRLLTLEQIIQGQRKCWGNENQGAMENSKNEKSFSKYY